MPDPEYRRWLRMTADQYDEACQALGMPADRTDSTYKLRLQMGRELALDGKGPAAFFERWMAELEKYHQSPAFKARQSKTAPQSGAVQHSRSPSPKHTRQQERRRSPRRT